MNAPPRRDPRTPGQRDCDLVRHPAGEEILRGIAGIVLERKHGDDRARRRLRRGGSECGAERERGSAETPPGLSGIRHAFALPMGTENIAEKRCAGSHRFT